MMAKRQVRIPEQPGSSSSGTRQRRQLFDLDAERKKLRDGDAAEDLGYKIGTVLYYTIVVPVVVLAHVARYAYYIACAIALVLSFFFKQGMNLLSVALFLLVIYQIWWFTSVIHENWPK